MSQTPSIGRNDALNLSIHRRQNGPKLSCSAFVNKACKTQDYRSSIAELGQLTELSPIHSRRVSGTDLGIVVGNSAIPQLSLDHFYHPQSGNQQAASKSTNGSTLKKSNAPNKVTRSSRPMNPEVVAASRLVDPAGFTVDSLMDSRTPNHSE